MAETRVLLDADVRVFDEARRTAEALAIRDGRLLTVGRRADVLAAAGPAATIWNARGATVLPGFIDAHQHPCIAALYGGGVSLAGPEVTDVASLARTLARTASELPPGEWLVAMNWDEARLRERRAPTRTELDDAVPDRPVFALHYSCHRAVANSRALELAGIGRDTPDPAGGVISRGKGGLPDGLLVERGMSRVETLARASLRTRDAAGFMDRLARHFRALVAAGITRVVDAAVPGDLAVLYREAKARGVLPIPTVLMPVSVTGYLETPWDALDGPTTGERDGVLEIGPVKLILDGAPACAMCLSFLQLAAVSARTLALAARQGSLDPMRVAMSTRPRLGRRIRTGIRLYAPDEAKDFVRRASERGFRVASHAEGNDAIALALDAYEAAGGALRRAGRPRLEHVVFADRDCVRRIADQGALAVVQPHFLSLSAFGSAPTIPGMPANPLRWLLDAGVALAGSSDFPVTGFDPFDGIRSAVRRRTPNGVREPEQAITLDEALTAYTRGAALAAGCQGECGTLEPHKRADFVVLEGRLASEKDLDATRVRATVVGGELAFGSL
jgi:predicted amidohydrolase YtcJ